VASSKGAATTTVSLTGAEFSFTLSRTSRQCGTFIVKLKNVGSVLALKRDKIVTLVDLAATAAHESGQRTNAPLLCCLWGKEIRFGLAVRVVVQLR
jgi:hypothetical protein